MAITQISNNVILDGTILPAKLNVSANMRTFLGNETISTINGSSSASGTLTLQSTTNATKGKIIFGTSAYDEANNRLGVGTQIPTNDLQVSLTGSTLNRGIEVTHSTGGFLRMANGTSDASTMIPVFTGKGVASSHASGLIFIGQSANDANFAYGVISFSARNNAGTGVVSDSQRAFEFSNFTTPLMTIRGNGNVGIGTPTPNASAILQLNSTNKGFLPPVMTSTERNAISSPAAGLVVYSSDLFDLSLYNGTAWGEVLTTHAASFTSDTLAAALSDESGTGGGFTRAEGATHTSPTINTSLTLNATNYTYGAGAREAMLNSMSNRFVYKNGLIPYAEIFDDFPTTGGTHSWNTVAGTTAYYTNGTSVARFWGAISMTTAATIDASAGITPAPSGGANGQTASRYGLSTQVCFCINNNTSVEFLSRFAGGGSTLDVRLDFVGGTLSIVAPNIGGAGVNFVNAATGLSLASGNFVSGKRYRLFTKIISATQTELYLAEADWNNSVWTTLVDTIVTHAAVGASAVSSQPFFFVLTKTNVARIAYIDWIAIRHEVQR